MCEIKTVIIVAALLLVATGFCVYQVKPKVEHIKTVLIVAVLLLAAAGLHTYQVNSEQKWDNIAKSKVKVLAKKSSKSIV